jgi:hypothetical protein
MLALLYRSGLLVNRFKIIFAKDHNLRDLTVRGVSSSVSTTANYENKLPVEEVEKRARK